MKAILFFLSVTTILIWIAYFSLPSKNLRVIACNVGQGDAILITSGQEQVLVDGGPDKSVLSCLGKYLPYWDREIELVVLTHPEADHLTGLVEVFERYSVINFLASEIENSTDTYEVLRNTVGGSDAKVINPKMKMVLGLGLMHLEVVNGWQGDVNPENVLGVTNPEQSLNDYSVAMSLKYGDFDALLTGDIGPKLSDEIARSGLVKNVEYIKIPHHGSKNGLTENLLRVSDPEVAVISVGKDNRFGHPHQEILDMLQDRNIEILRTDEIGDVVVESNGDRWWVKQ